jgi:hypothetical protein
LGRRRSPGGRSGEKNTGPSEKLGYGFADHEIPKALGKLLTTKPTRA